MASVRQFKNSKNWYACYTLPDGTRVQKSTKLTNRRDAQKLADDLEAVTRKKLSDGQARRLYREIFKGVHGVEVGGNLVRDHVEKWVERKKGETSDQTAKKYGQVAEAFLKYLGEKASSELIDITKKDILGFRDEMASRVSPTTVNNALKVVRVIFGDAQSDELIPANPAQTVKTLSLKGHVATRRGFTIEELKRLLESCDDEWRRLVLFGLYTGQRLGDLARLTWNNIHLDRQEIRLVTRKTDRQQIIPIASPLRRCIETMPAGDNPQQPLFPVVFALVEKHGDTGYLSTLFNKIMVSAGLARPHSRGATPGAEKTERRILNELSFHSLRHTATSMMKNAGISPAIVGDIIGHDSAEMSTHYTHVEESSKRKALEAMPDVWPKEKA